MSIPSSFRPAMEYAIGFIGRPECLFLVLSAIFGIILVFVTPPMQAPDEQTHFFQAYAISDFNLIPQRFDKNHTAHYGSRLPVSVYNAAYTFLGGVAGVPNKKFNTDLYGQYLNQPLNRSEKRYVDGTGYSPIVYIPQAIGITIGKIFNTSPLIMIWLGRLMNLTAWIIILYCSIKILPFGKWAMVILALNPMAVFLSASLSSDVMNTALVFLFFSLIVATLSSTYIFTKKRMALTIGVLCLIALAKPISILVAALLLIVPWRRFKTKRKYILFCAVALIVSVGLALLWSSITNDASIAISQFQRPGMGINPIEQLTGIIHNPLGYIKTLLLNYVIVTPGYYGDAVFKTFFGVFGWLDTEIPLWTIVVYVVSLFFALLFQFGRGLALSIYQKSILVAIFVLLFIGNITALYLYYTPVGGSIIAGVQGRYFIASSILLVGIFTARKKILDINEKSLAVVLGSMVFIVLSMTLLRIFIRYYI